MNTKKNIYNKNTILLNFTSTKHFYIIYRKINKSESFGINKKYKLPVYFPFLILMNVQADNPLSVLVDFYIRWHSVLLDEALYHKLYYCNKFKKKIKKKYFNIYENLPIIILTSCRWWSSSIKSIIFYWIVRIIIWFWFRHISVWFIWYTSWNLYELWI